ncbi:hypothetical protein FJY68_01420 [candidate division WOR-3 bacterium]|uniref:Uncharacterized protein n=1 Tax=candidate division WOR-3 bacterium TaxID=2052148 RepID=A0A938BT13_UNCW3|nr:hypothetical protein [candidate division WOR-3 bacterium]
MLYQLEKWYFDFLTEAGDYFFGYFAQVAFLGTRTSELALHLRRAGTDEPVKWSGRLPAEVSGGATPTIDFPAGRLTFSPAAASVAVNLPDASVRLEYTARPLTDPGLAIAARRGTVLWQPVMLGAMVQGEVQLRGRTIVASNVRGYDDYLRSTVLPPSVPVRTLFWGRAHDSYCDLTYTVASGPAGAWPRLVLRIGERVIVATDVKVEPSEWRPSPELGIACPSRYRLNATGPGLGVELDVVHESAAVESEFISGPLLRRITRNPRGVKFTGRAVARIEHSGTTLRTEVPLLDEYALFD